MTMSMYVVAALLVAALCWGLLAVRRSHRRLGGLFRHGDRVRVQQYLEALTESRDPAAHVIFEDMDGSRRFVQFRRDASANGATLTCHFPRAPWSQTHIGALNTLLARRKLVASETTVQPGRAVTAFIIIEGLRANEAARLTDAIFRHVFGHDTLRVRVWGQGVKGPR